jgi:hypothetical protein
MSCKYFIIEQNVYMMLEYRDLKNAEVELREIVREHPDAISVESSCPTKEWEQMK